MNRSKRFFISALISFAVLYLIFRKIDINQLISLIMKADKLYLLLGLFLYSCIVIFKSLRFTILFQKAVSFREMLPVALVHNFLTNFLPLKIGELSFPFLLSKIRKGMVGKSVFCLVMGRLFDFIVLSCMLLAGIAYSSSLPSVIAMLLPIVFALFFCAIAAIILAIALHERLAGYLEGIRLKNKTIDSLREKAAKFLMHFSALKSGSVLIGSFIMTWLIFISGFATTMALLQGMGYPIRLSILLILLPLTALSTVIPINGIAGIGTYEGVWAAVLTFHGYSLETSLLLGFSTHLLQISYLLITGAAGWSLSGHLWQKR